MSLAFRDTAVGMARFVKKKKKMDCNAYRFLEIQTAVEDAIACYREICEEKKRATIQSGLK